MHPNLSPIFFWYFYVIYIKIVLCAGFEGFGLDLSGCKIFFKGKEIERIRISSISKILMKEIQSMLLKDLELFLNSIDFQKSILIMDGVTTDTLMMR